MGSSISSLLRLSSSAQQLRFFATTRFREWEPHLCVALHSEQMSVFMAFCGPHLPIAFQFVCGPGGRRAANKLRGKWSLERRFPNGTNVFKSGPFLPLFRILSVPPDISAVFKSG